MVRAISKGAGGRRGAATRSAALMLAALCLALAGPGGGFAHAQPAPRAFPATAVDGHRALVGDAAWLPIDVDLIIAGERLGPLARPPIAGLLADLVAREQRFDATMQAWSELSRLLRMEPIPAFDAVLAERFIFAARRPTMPHTTRSRTAGTDASPVEWVIVTLVDEPTARRVAQSLRAAPRGVQDGRTLLMLEGGTYTLDLRHDATRDRVWMSIGPSSAPGLFERARQQGPGTGLLAKAAAAAAGEAAARWSGHSAFEPIRAMARSFHAATRDGVDPDSRADEGARFFAFARLDDRGAMLLDVRGRERAAILVHDDWLAVFGAISGPIIRMDTIRRSAVLARSDAGGHAWVATPFDRLAEGSLSAGIFTSAALRPGGGGLGAALVNISGAPGLAELGTVAERLGLPPSRLAWVIDERAGVLDAAISIETQAVDGLVAQGDAFMRSVLAPLAGGEVHIRQGLAGGPEITDQSMRVVRMKRPGDPKRAEAGVTALINSVAWTYRVCPQAALVDEDCPTAWWTVGLSPQLAGAITDTLTEEHMGLPQDWLSLQFIRPRALLARLVEAGVPAPGSLQNLRRVESLHWREALLHNGLVLGQGTIEAGPSDDVPKR